MSERQGQVGGLNVLWRQEPPQTAAPVVYLHGVPTDGDDWLPFLERTGGYAPDLPGFGRSDKPPHFAYSIAGYTRWLTAFVEEAGLDRFSLVMHDWGGVGLALAQEMPERIERLVVIDAVPLLPGYRWHRVARLWRTPLVGELTMGFTFKRGMRTMGGMRRDLVERIWPHFDHGTQRAILKLYRSAPADGLAGAGVGLRELTAPALVIWGADDPFIAPEFAHSYAGAFGGEARAEVIEGAGHWPWLDQPDVVDRVAKFLA